MSWSALNSVLRTGPLPWLLGLAGAGFLGSVLLSAVPSLPALCGSLERVDLADLGLLLGPQWSAAAVLAGWLIMLIAMMPPLLAQPVLHVWRSSIHARRPQALALFGLAYGAVWLAAGVLLIPAAIALLLAVPGPAAQMIALCVAIAWSGSPAAQMARNRCHRMKRIGAFGRYADSDCIRQGVVTGTACLSACWPWMLVPMMFDDTHLVAMAAVSVVLFAERLAPAAQPGWQLPAALVVARSLRTSQKVLGRS